MWWGAGMTVADESRADRPGGHPTRTAVSGSAARRLYTVVVFIVLASLDNVVIGMQPPLLSPISQALDVTEASVGFAIGASYLVSAIAAVAWAYFGDRTNRKPLLMIGTLVWAVGALATAGAPNFLAFVGSQVIAAIGLGAVASVGFSVVSDLISPHRRGLVMSFWGLSQGIGSVLGVMLVAVFGASNWRLLFLALTGAGLVATAAYLFTANIRRGESEPQLAAVFAAGDEYDYRISRADLPTILRRRTNLWLILQGFTAQLVFGSLAFVPRLFQAKAESLGYQRDTAIAIGAVYATLFTLGALLSIVGGLVGDRLQRRTPRGRAIVASVGILTAIPFYVLLFFLPLRLDVADGAGTGAVINAVLGSIVTEPAMAVSFVAALLALALTSANSPNWFALITEVNPPEHRGTVFSLGNLVNGVGRATGTGVIGVSFAALERIVAQPLNYAVGLAAFQLFFIPTGIMYWLASRTAPRDIATVQAMLEERAAEVSTTAHPRQS